MAATRGTRLGHKTSWIIPFVPFVDVADEGPEGSKDLARRGIAAEAPLGRHSGGALPRREGRAGM